MRSIITSGLLGLGALGVAAVPAQASWLSEAIRALTGPGYYDPYCSPPYAGRQSYYYPPPVYSVPYVAPAPYYVPYSRYPSWSGKHYRYYDGRYDSRYWRDPDWDERRRWHRH
jgi:hypothetical protein